MGCLGQRNRHVEFRPEQKWDYISLNDFKSTSCWTFFAYGYLFYSLLLSMAVYGVDTFTAVNLLAFNRWSSEITPAISFDISKWIFSVCIILSFVNLGYEHIRAQRVIRRGNVAECYLDNLAVRLESIRMGKGRGFKRFLVFAELTKSKKGAEYVAFFTYFSFQAWFRILLCSGPRQVINALTLWSVYNAKLSQTGGQDVGNTILGFFAKLRTLAIQDSRQTVILSGMLFTLVIWAFSLLALLLAVFFYLFYLWSIIPTEAGGLSGFCARKVNKRLMKIVSTKIDAGIAKEAERRKKAEAKAAMRAGERPPQELKATIPDVGGDSLPAMPMLSRNDTMTTLPAYSSRPGTPGNYELNALDQKWPLPARSATKNSTTSQFSARQPLVGAAAEFGMRPESPAPSLPSMDFDNYPLTRTATNRSNMSFGAQSQMNRMQGNGPAGNDRRESPEPYPLAESMPAIPQPSALPRGPQGYYRPQQRSNSPMSRGPTPARFDKYSNGRASPAPSVQSYRGNSTSAWGPSGPQDGPGGYPQRSATAPIPSRGPPGGPPYHTQRNMTAPVPLRTPQLQQQQQQQSTPSFGNDYDYYNRPPTAGPGGNSGRQTPRGGFGAGWNDLESQRGPAPGPNY